MKKVKRYSVRITGHSGQGINSMGEILSDALKDSGYKVFAYREYPSLIRGGVASYQVEFSDYPIRSPKREADLMVSISRTSLIEYVDKVVDNGTIIHSIPKMFFPKEKKKLINDNSLSISYVNADEKAVVEIGSKIVSNVLLVAQVWKLLGLDKEILEKTVLETFADKKKYIEHNRKAVEIGYGLEIDSKLDVSIDLKPDPEWRDSYVMSGNHAITLGAVSAGLSTYYAYPMTPASSILTYMAEIAPKKDILVKQAEDEITAVQMALGSMYTGSRSMTATSGGGFDLMSETLTYSGVAEIPLVVVLAQRHGAATGLPTWTGAADLNLALNAGHGEFPRLVVAVSDPKSAYRLTQEAFNYAEEYQLPVVLMTEKQIAESLFNIDEIGSTTEIERGLVNKEFLDELESTDRYKFTDSGISRRWLPGQSEATYNANSDEHNEKGDSTEDSLITKSMQNKRAKKLSRLVKELPEPEVYGGKDADLSFIGWGSTKNIMLDLIQILETEHNINYLHFEYLYPLKTEKLLQFIDEGKQIVVLENNSTGQLADLIAKEASVTITNRLLKYDGRPFFLEELIEFVENNILKPRE